MESIHTSVELTVLNDFNDPGSTLQDIANKHKIPLRVIAQIFADRIIKG